MRGNRSARSLDRASYAISSLLLVAYFSWTIIVLRETPKTTVNEFLYRALFFSLFLTGSFAGVFAIPARIFIMRRSSFTGEAWRFRGDRLAHCFSILQRIVTLLTFPAYGLIFFRVFKLGEEIPGRLMFMILLYSVYVIIVEHPFKSWLIFEDPVVELSPEGIVVRPMWGEGFSASWIDTVCFEGLAPPVSALLTSRGGRSVQTRRVIMEAGAMSFSQLENVIEHFSQHPEDRSLLGSEKGKNLLTSLVKVPW